MDADRLLEAFRAGWSAEGPAVAWGVPRKPGDHNRPPVRCALCLDDLTLSTEVDPKAFSSDRMKLGTLSVENGAKLVIREGDKVLATVTNEMSRTLSKDEQHATTAKPNMRPLPLAKP